MRPRLFETIFAWAALRTKSLSKAGLTLCCALIFLTATQSNAATIVTNTTDAGPGSFRDVVANSTPGEIIAFAPSLSGQHIILTSGQITLDRNLSIDASMLPQGVILDGNSNSAIFLINSSTTVSLNAVTISNANDANYTGGLRNFGNLLATNCLIVGNWNGGIENQGTLLLSRCILAGNSEVGVFNALNAGATITDSIISNNWSSAFGGGVLNSGFLTLSNSTVTLNTALNGGGIRNVGTFRADSCTFSGNSATNNGGAFSNTGELRLNQCTLVGNVAVIGGAGVRNTATGSVFLDSCTVTSNSAGTRGGGIDHAGASFYATNSIIAGNIAGTSAEFSGALIGSGNLTNGNPMLAPLRNYGGPTPTMPPLQGSPAVDACTNGVTFAVDQRGLPRVAGSYADSGAVEGTFNLNFQLFNPLWQNSGTFVGSFSNLAGAGFTVVATTNLASPIETWSNLGPAVETPASSGQYQFTDPEAAGFTQRFYRVRSP